MTRQRAGSCATRCISIPRATRTARRYAHITSCRCDGYCSGGLLGRMTLSLRVVAQAVLMLTSIGVYATLGALRAAGGVLTSIVLVALLTFVAILLHELAHAAAAQIVGARINAIVALPFRLRIRPRRHELVQRGAQRGDLGGYGTYTLDRIDARRKHAIIAAAGPLANLALAVLAGTTAPLFDHSA